MVTLLVAALATSILSAILGMGGGILLLAVMFCFLPHGQAIPIHAIVQLVSNSTRVVAFRRHIDWRTVLRFAGGVLPGGLLGAVVMWRYGRAEASEPYLKMIVGAYVVISPFLPKPKSEDGSHARPWDFPFIGFLAGAMALTVGAVGPLIAPIFARRDFVKERLIATKAACQMLTHFIKLPVFIALGTFALGELWAIALPMALVVIPGTLIGRRLVRFVAPSAFTAMYRAALVVAGLKVLLFDGIMKLS